MASPLYARFDAGTETKQDHCADARMESSYTMCPPSSTACMLQVATASHTTVIVQCPCTLTTKASGGTFWQLRSHVRHAQLCTLCPHHFTFAHLAAITLVAITFSSAGRADTAPTGADVLVVGASVA